MGATHPTPAENTSPLSAKLEGREPDPKVLAGDIDSRLAALLADHQEMGSRPKDEPQSPDLYPARYPIPGAKTIEPNAHRTKPEPKKASKGK